MSSGSSCADSPVESARSQNITVSCRRSAPDNSRAAATESSDASGASAGAPTRNGSWAAFRADNPTLLRRSTKGTLH
jgi:hypothetical protein